MKNLHKSLLPNFYGWAGLLVWVALFLLSCYAGRRAAPTDLHESVSRVVEAGVYYPEINLFVQHDPRLPRDTMTLMTIDSCGEWVPMVAIPVLVPITETVCKHRYVRHRGTVYKTNPRQDSDGRRDRKLFHTCVCKWCGDISICG